MPSPQVNAAPTGDKKPEGGFRLVPIGELLARPKVPPDYLVDGLLIRGTVSCVVSKPKVGNSTFARGLALAVARGKPFLERSTRQGACIYLALEERHEEITADFRAMGATEADPITVHAEAAPASAVLSLIGLAHIRDEKAYAEVYAALGPLIDLARETGTHILLTHHSGKSPKVDPIDSPLGSTAIGGAAATTIVLNRREAYRTVQTVTRIGPVMPETVLSFDPETRLLSVGRTRAEAYCQEIEKEIVKYLETGEDKTEPEIVDQVEGTNAVKRNALRSLVKKQVVNRSGTGKSGDPYKYSYACTEHIARTSVQDTENRPRTTMDIDESVVRENRENQCLVREKKTTEKDDVSLRKTDDRLGGANRETEVRI
jgi:predicted transcriptional regulator